MTDDADAPRTLRVWECVNREHPDRACHGLVEDTKDARIAHRRKHAQDAADREALRDAIKARDEAVSELRVAVAEFRRLVESYERTVSGLHHEVARVETPAPPPALEISRHDYDDEDDLEDGPRTDLDLELPADLEPAAASRYVGDEDDDEDEPVDARSSWATR